MPRGRNLAITALMLALIAASGIAFVKTQTLKLEKPAARLIEVPELVSPDCECPYAQAKLKVLLQREETVNVRIVSDDDPDRVVATLATGLAVPPGRVGLRWDGRDDAGEPAEPGQYRVRVELAQEGRTYTFADRIKLVHPERVPGFEPEQKKR